MNQTKETQWSALMPDENRLYDFEQWSSITPFDVYAADNSTRRFLPSPTQDATWIHWTYWSDVVKHGGNGRFVNEECHVALSPQQLMAFVPQMALTTKVGAGEENICDYLQGASEVCYEEIQKATRAVEKLGPNALINPDSDDVRFDKLGVFKRQLHTVVVTAWSYFNAMRAQGERPPYEILPGFGEQFHLSDPYEEETAVAGERWQVQVTCLWEPDENNYARHEMAYGRTLNEANDAGDLLKERLMEEWDLNVGVANTPQQGWGA